jgi:hypothetical protein
MSVGFQLCVQLATSFTSRALTPQTVRIKRTLPEQHANISPMAPCLDADIILTIKKTAHNPLICSLEDTLNCLCCLLSVGSALRVGDVVRCPVQCSTNALLQDVTTTITSCKERKSSSVPAKRAVIQSWDRAGMLRTCLQGYPAYMQQTARITQRTLHVLASCA